MSMVKCPKCGKHWDVKGDCAVCLDCCPASFCENHIPNEEIDSCWWEQGNKKLPQDATD